MVRTRPVEMYSPPFGFAQGRLRHRGHKKTFGVPNLTMNADPSRSRRIRVTARLIPLLRRLLRGCRLRSRGLVRLGRVWLFSPLGAWGGFVLSVAPGSDAACCLPAAAETPRSPCRPNP